MTVRFLQEVQQLVTKHGSSRRALLEQVVSNCQLEWGWCSTMLGSGQCLLTAEVVCREIDDDGQLIDPLRVDWNSEATFITPPG